MVDLSQCGMIVGCCVIFSYALLLGKRVMKLRTHLLDMLGLVPSLLCCLKSLLGGLLNFLYLDLIDLN